MKRVATVALVFAFAASIVSVHAATGDQIYAHPGRLVNAGPTKLNFYCTGSGTPTVVFDAGWEDWSPSWVLIQPVIARHTRTCTYDRAGSGFSEAGPMPRTSVEIAKELHTALHNAHIPVRICWLDIRSAATTSARSPTSTCRRSMAKFSWTSRTTMSHRRISAVSTSAEYLPGFER